MKNLSSEDFGSIPNPSASFGTVPNDSDPFRTIRNSAERTEQHTLTVREVARMFEQSGVARTERSITNWCQPNRQGVARLDAFFDTNERKYFITEQSANLAIAEEQAKQSATGNDMPTRAETSEPRPADTRRSSSESDSDADEQEEFRRKLMDLEITNRVKDELLKNARTQLEQADQERKAYIERLISDNRRIGELETQLLQLGGGDSERTLRLPHGSEADDR
jgi:hypothetical protein